MPPTPPDPAPMHKGDVLEVPPTAGGMRLDRFLADRFGVSRSLVQAWLEAGCFVIADAPGKKSRLLEAGESIAVAVEPRPRPIGVKAQAIPLKILYEDDDIVVVDKPKGMVVHPGSGNQTGTLANALAGRYPALSGTGGGDRPGIVHRLDKDTSGLLVAARNDSAHAGLARQLADRSMRREYRCLVWDLVSPPTGRVDAPIGRHRRNPVRRQVRPDGKPAVTNYEVLEYLGLATLLRLSLESGRTHQVRVHMAHIGHPVVGDPAYGGSDPRVLPRDPRRLAAARALLKLLPTQALHAFSLRLVHPATGEALHFESPLTDEFRRALEILQPWRQPPDY